ncbi:alpha/beta fold hydrolase [Acidiferrimicrobium sp. IK]|uniref:alpha/beta fold hydrolase n=1 Tax=Acidiferrimicrobium sp. IK TaxID=2871700 RepID=UPI0021CB4870|nr:alpha/beta hydrolase [Acidiferrimicrobium sp. IK]
MPFTDGFVDVEGASVHYVAWGEPGQRGLVFVHGGGANAHWWTHVAAAFASERRVVAVDLSGHGDSSHRERYDLGQWAREVLSAADHAGAVGPPVIVGHSMGGFVAIATASLHPAQVEGIIACDSPVTEPDPEVDSSRRVQEVNERPRLWASREMAVDRFRTVPPQANYLDFVRDHVARRSLKPVEGGWQWKSDRALSEQFQQHLQGMALPYLETLAARFALLRSEFGLVTDDIGASMFEVTGRKAPVFVLPEAGHHPMLDQPLSLLAALRALLADWDHSEPHRRLSSESTWV